MIEVGSVVAGTYTIEAQLGRGGMGTVFLAVHSRLPGKRVALKVLRADVASDEMVARFKREAQIVSQLAHPNIVHVEDFNVTPDGTPYLVLEYLQGESLAQRLVRGPLPVETALAIARQIGAALAAAHVRGIIHRDLKPQNIFLVPSERGDHVKVLDFGISKVVDSAMAKAPEDRFATIGSFIEALTGKRISLPPLAANRYIGVTVDGERVGGVPEAP